MTGKLTTIKPHKVATFVDNHIIILLAKVIYFFIVALEDQQPQEVEMVRVPSYQPQKKQHSKEHDSPTTFKTEADSGVEPDTHGSKLQPDIDSHILERPTTASDHYQ
jgi:hypothetical protein